MYLFTCLNILIETKAHTGFNSNAGFVVTTITRGSIFTVMYIAI